MNSKDTKQGKQTKKSELTNHLEDIKSLFEFPKFFISNIFSDLKTEIDSAFVYDLTNEKDTEQKQDINESWIEVIDHVNKLEEKYLEFKLNEQTKSEIGREIEAIERKISAGINKKNSSQIKQTIQALEQKLKKLLFQNGTVSVNNITFNHTYLITRF